MLEISNVQAGYGQLKILRGINLKVPAGKIVALLGGNGTGKSTLLKAISGLIPIMDGDIKFDGQNIKSLQPHERVKLGIVQVTQSKEAYPAMTVEENLLVGAFSRTDKKIVLQDLSKVYDFFPVLKKRRKQQTERMKDLALREHLRKKNREQFQDPAQRKLRDFSKATLS